MPKFTVYKDLRLKVEVEAPTAQAAFDWQLELNDNTFEVVDCNYEVFDAENNSVTDEVQFG